MFVAVEITLTVLTPDVRHVDMRPIGSDSHAVRGRTDRDGTGHRIGGGIDHADGPGAAVGDVGVGTVRGNGHPERDPSRPDGGGDGRGTGQPGVRGDGDEGRARATARARTMPFRTAFRSPSADVAAWCRNVCLRRRLRPTVQHRKKNRPNRNMRRQDLEKDFARGISA